MADEKHLARVYLAEQIKALVDFHDGEHAEHFDDPIVTLEPVAHVLVAKLKSGATYSIVVEEAGEPRSYYQRRISEIVRTEFDPRHVEAYMRLKHGTLDALDRRTFIVEAAIACHSIAEAGQDEAEKLARSYGL